MLYSLEPRERRHVKEYPFLSFARNIGTHATKVAKNTSNKSGQKIADIARKSAADVIKTASKGAIQKKAEATEDLVDNKVADKITSTSKKPLDEESLSTEVNKDTYLQNRGNKLLMN